MKRVQDVFKQLGIPAWPDAYKKPDGERSAERQYVVYVTRTIEDEHYDDAPQTTRTFVYMNLWSAGNPTETARRIRKAMRQAGFAMEEEAAGSTTGDGQYAETLKMYCISWTWICWDVIDDGD